MRKTPCIFAMAAVLLTAGCIPPSLHQLYTDEDLVFEPLLVGTWIEKGDNNSVWEFKIAGEKQYELSMTQDEVTSSFEVHLLRLDDNPFLDFFPKDPEIGNDFYQIHLIPAHTFARIGLDGDRLRMVFISPEWLHKQFEEGTINISCEMVDDFVILTAPTKDLQAFVKKYADDEEAFVQTEGVLELIRQK